MDFLIHGIFMKVELHIECVYDSLLFMSFGQLLKVAII